MLLRFWRLNIDLITKQINYFCIISAKRQQRGTLVQGNRKLHVCQESKSDQFEPVYLQNNATV